MTQKNISTGFERPVQRNEAAAIEKEEEKFQADIERTKTTKLDSEEKMAEFYIIGLPADLDHAAKGIEEAIEKLKVSKKIPLTIPLEKQQKLELKAAAERCDVSVYWKGPELLLEV